jgi:hypothetical protein
VSNPTALQAMYRLATNIKADTAVKNAWVYPDQFSAINTASLPVAIVMRRIAIPQEWGWWAFGVGTRRWEAEVFLLLSKGEINGFSAKSGEIEKLHFGWPTTIADVLAGDITLNGLCEYIGNGEQGADGVLFNYTIEHMMWAQEVYWGIHFNIPITQRITHEVG